MAFSSIVLFVSLGSIVPIQHDASKHVTCNVARIWKLRDNVYGREHLALLTAEPAPSPRAPSVGADGGGAHEGPRAPRALPLLLPFNEGDDLLRALADDGDGSLEAPGLFADFGRAALLLERRQVLEQALALRHAAQLDTRRAPLPWQEQALSGRQSRESGTTLTAAEIAALPGRTASAALYSFLIRCGLTPRIAVLTSAAPFARAAVRQASMGMLTASAPTSARLGTDAGISARLLCVDAAERPLSLSLKPSDAIAVAALGRGRGLCALQIEATLLEARGIAMASVPPGELLGEWRLSSGDADIGTGLMSVD
jgi:hypothetical protein